jgi:hypothetical protein
MKTTDDFLMMIEFMMIKHGMQIGRQKARLHPVEL